ncbi:MAG: hypothetical protein LKJ29_07135 [Lactobacillus sp.]|nr:hypothetical protein [Lactobacillus sp.]MCI1941811.1 hypothetical protein [Lactobacillus sp.]MCI1972607.1 hypothetical protein [Lactobacillus sp.]
MQSRSYSKSRFASIVILGLGLFALAQAPGFIVKANDDVPNQVMGNVFSQQPHLVDSTTGIMPVLGKGVPRTTLAKSVLAQARTAVVQNQPDVITIGDTNRPKVDAVDVASYQSWMQQSDYNKLKSLGVQTVVVKVIQGNGYQKTAYFNSVSVNSIKYAQKAGLNVAVYDYATFNSAAAAKSEADNTAYAMQKLGLSKDMLVFADMEDTKCNVAYLADYWSQLSVHGYHNQAVYTGGGYSGAQQAVETVGASRTWWAQYPYSPKANSLWNTNYGAWQFSSTARIPGGSTSSLIDVSHDYKGLLTTTVLPQGPKYADDRYVTVTSKNYITYNAFSFVGFLTNAQVYQRTFHSTGQYHHINGNTYLSLYDNAGKWAGYINEKAVTVGKGHQGAWLSANKYATLTQANQKLLPAFDATTFSSTSPYLNNTYHVTGEYHDINGDVYYSLYDQNSRWLGYIKSTAVTVTSQAQGPWQSDNRYVTVTDSNYMTYSSFDFFGKMTNAQVYHRTFRSTGQYHHANGQTYLSLYDVSGGWAGYINARAVSVGKGHQGAWLPADKYATLTQPNQKLLAGFDTAAMGSTSTYLNNTYHVTGEYHDINGDVFYSIYDSTDHWLGYVKAAWVATSEQAQGIWQTKDGYVAPTKKGTIWASFDFLSGVSDQQYPLLQVKGLYHHANGRVYYSVYDLKGKWIGYLDASLTKTQDQGLKQADDRYVTVTSQNYITYNGFDFYGLLNNTQVYQHTFYSSGMYHHANGSTYLSIYDGAGKWAGYINEKAVTVGKGHQGAWLPADKYATLTQPNQKLLAGFDTATMGSTSSHLDNTYHITGKYHDIDGRTFFSLYDTVGRWLGYVQSDWVAVSSQPQGVWLQVDRTVQVVDQSYTIWASFDFLSGQKAAWYKTLKVKGEYHHFNGSIFLSVYNPVTGAWIGYLNAKAVK